VALYVTSGFYRVQPGEKGVVLRFGKVYDITDPGLRYRLPQPIMTHTIVNTSAVRREEIGFRSDPGRTRSFPAESLMLTGDENIADVQLVVQYVVQDPVKFLYGADDPRSALRVSAEVALRAVVGENTIDHTMPTAERRFRTRYEPRFRGFWTTTRPVCRSPRRNFWSSIRRPKSKKPFTMWSGPGKTGSAS
jgi:modulator of FtsH protease HflK